MTEDDDSDSKTEAPSTKKIEDALRKGNAPISREVSLFASTLAFLIYLLFFVPSGFLRIAQDLRDFFEKYEQLKLNTVSNMLIILINIGLSATKLVLPGLLLFMIFGVGSYLIQRIPSPNLENLKPRLKRISLKEGIKRIYSKNNLINFTKSFLKIFIVGILIESSLQDNYFRMVESISSNPQWTLYEIFLAVQEILIIILLFTALLTVADLGWTYHQWYSKLKMTKQEVKDEMKQSYGNPLVKSRQRSIARSKMRHRMIEATSRATLVIVNPTHYALALRYVQEENDAPIMLAKGQNLIALKIRETAFKKNIPIFEEPILARSLFRQVPVNSAIPSVFYKAVAQLVHKIYSKNR
ncbi:flagellar type III secretion system protein FlhB [Candidatus Liberibacter sp.]|uniref:flagellar type III secretion system protein FlhB n=1 Tax=Candidatus Liberibacter sp. TaxID=34022 RepID=UPI0015F555A2|nr:flagellar type III secretion system protein FlhB [Candidatus Liberibacter sp.]MBA5723614.1 flagellar biosynthesis protein FlhB [Candidatus Liberibacter sp.]